MTTPPSPETLAAEYVAWVKRYYNDPVGLVEQVLGATPYRWQRDFLTAIARGDRNLAVASGHRVGKSTVLAWVAIWYMLTRVPFKIGVTAPTSGQLNDALYAELRAWLLKLPSGLQGLLEVQSDRVNLVSSKGTSFLTIKTGRVDQPEALAGLHSPNTLLIGDEASGIAEPVFEASSSSMAADNAQMILCGNPLRAVGYFAKCFTDWKDRWTTFSVSSIDCAGVSRAWIEEKKSEYGEESNAYRARVLGLFPRGDDDTIIPLELVTSAVGRDIVEAPGASEIWGLDVAEKGDNVSALCRRKPHSIPVPVEIFAGLETMQLVGRIAAMYNALPEPKRPVEVNIDAIGVGAGVADRLRELGLPVNAVNVAETPSVAGEKVYFNRRTELWYQCRQWFAERTCSIPKDDRLISDLTKIRFDNTEGRSDRLKAEGKKAMLKRGIKSPDVGDACVLTFAGQGVSSIGHAGYHRYRNQPIRRRSKAATYV